jgi:hypothetical protein
LARALSTWAAAAPPSIAGAGELRAHRPHRVRDLNRVDSMVLTKLMLAFSVMSGK